MAAGRKCPRTMPTVSQQRKLVEIRMVGVGKQTAAELSRGPLFFLRQMGRNWDREHDGKAVLSTCGGEEAWSNKGGEGGGGGGLVGGGGGGGGGGCVAKGGGGVGSSWSQCTGTHDVDSPLLSSVSTPVPLGCTSSKRAFA